jgi:hypothetical protein
LNKFSRELIKSLGEGADQAGSARLHVLKVPDGRAIRRKLYLWEQEFAQNNSFAGAEKLRAASSAAKRARGSLRADLNESPRNQRSSEAVM